MTGKYTKLKKFLPTFIIFSFLTCLTVYFLQAEPDKTLYWESPVSITGVDSRFPKTIFDDKKLYIFFEEVDKKKEEITISFVSRKEGELKWSEPKKVAGPFAYSGADVPDIFSVALSKDKSKIAFSVLTSMKSIGVYVTEDGCETFSGKEFTEQVKSVIGPRIFRTSTGGFMLFASLGENGDSASSSLGSFSLLSSRSDNGIDWTELEPFKPAAEITNPFVPYLAEFEKDGKKGDVVLFQGFAPSSAIFQIFMAESFDRQSTWSAPKALTVHPQYRSQRPVAYTKGGQTYIAWERTETRSDKAQIMFAELNSDGTLSEVYEITDALRGGSAHRPAFFEYNGSLSLVWFDDRKGVDGIYMAQRQGKFWNETSLVSLKRNSEFAAPLLIGDEIAFAWQQENSDNGDGRIFVLETDRSVQLPKIEAKSFTAGKRSTSEKVSAKVILPSDSSGIAGYTWIFTKSRRDEPAKDISILEKPSEVNISALATEDGEWFFKVRAYDYAGNWSETATLKYHRDLTPPQPPVITPVELDKYGFASTNSFTINWKNDENDEDIAGYSWNLTPIGTIDKNMQVNKTHPMRLSDSTVEKKISDAIIKYTKEKELKKWVNISRPPRKNMGSATSTSYKNPENGVYIFSVCAIDEVGNIGEPADALLILNKYIPSTKILNVTHKTDERGVISIGITGEGFLYDGNIYEIDIESTDKENRYIFKLKDGDYKINSDEKISGLKLDDMKAGKYTVTIRHSDRGSTIWNGVLNVSESGMVRHENTYFFEPDWRIFTPENFLFFLKGENLLMILLLILFALAIAATVRGLTKTIKEMLLTQAEIKALVQGGLMPMEKREQFFKKGVSLKFKLLMFTSVLIILIVTSVAFSLGKRLSDNQERTLLEGLQNRVDVVMESISSGVRNYLPEAADKTNEIMLLPSQTKYFKEANYATITGLPASGENTNIDYVWSSNDSQIESKIDSKELVQGVSRLSNPDEKIFGIVEKLNAEAVAQVQEISSRMELIRAEKEGADEKRNEELNAMLAELRSEIDSKLNDLSVDASSSIPLFSNEKLDRTQKTYMFYKPVLFRMSGDNETFVRSIVMMEVSTDTVEAEIDKALREIFIISIIVAVIAIVFGNLAALFIASIIVSPIRILVSHVKKIGETKDKEELEGEEISINSHDEIRTLSDAVNDMTKGLVKAAKDEKIAAKLREENTRQREAAAKAKEEAAQAQAEAQAIQEKFLKAQEADLKNQIMESDGRKIQTGFVPLNSVPRSEIKDTIASFKDKEIDLFCYYEGSDSLSGDYFGYKQLEDGYYAVMKCDVSGHGVPASLLTTILATGFNGYFGNWTFKKNGTRLNELALSLNESIGNLNLRGKFATLLIALFDSKKDEVYLCHAGDNIVRMYDSANNCQKTIKLAEAGAAGAIKRDMYEMMGMDYSSAYKTVKFPFKKNDILFLYTDGIEESQSKFKDKDFNNILKDENSSEFEYEEFGNDRIKEVVESLFNKRKYILKRQHPQNPDEVLEFDLTKCSSDISDMIIALASIEKVFRFYKRPSAEGHVTKDPTGKGKMEGDVVRVDRRIDEFLKKTFNMYDYYCSQKADIDEQNYIYYLNINEDKQEDDLTIYAIKNL